MASKRTGRKFLSDAVIQARKAKAPVVSRVTIISGGVKYKNGQAVARAYPAGSGVRAGVRRAIATPLLK